MEYLTRLRATYGVPAAAPGWRAAPAPKTEYSSNPLFQSPRRERSFPAACFETSKPPGYRERRQCNIQLGDGKQREDRFSVV